MSPFTMTCVPSISIFPSGLSLIRDGPLQQLERELKQAPSPDMVVFHPSMAAADRDRATRLIRTLGSAEGMEEAKEALRALVERIVLTPAAEGAGLDQMLVGDLAGLMSLAAGAGGPDTKKAPGVLPEAFDMSDELVLVAGAGFGHCFIQAR
ncbi:MAG: hypothetical protein HWE35_17040 [Rhodobacteraceae bacterium]|nr:hypothetical protein [Paracoccaceae bacterium]